MELLILFDAMGYRTPADSLARDDAAQRRAVKRMGKRFMMRKSCTSKASLRKELAEFKAAVRYVACNDVELEQQHLFKAEERQALRRLLPFALLGHHPAVNCWCLTSEAEKVTIEQAICAQRVAASRKQLRVIEEAKQAAARVGAQPAILLRKARLDMAGGIKWKRSQKEADTTVSRMKVNVPQPIEPRRYTSRLIACPACGKQKEIARMQLRTLDGYRDLHCLACGNHALGCHCIPPKHPLQVRLHLLATVIEHRCDTVNLILVLVSPWG